MSGENNSVCSSSSTDHQDGHLSCEPHPPIGRAASVFSDQLEKTDTRSVHFPNARGSPDSLRRTPMAVTGPFSVLSQQAGKASDRIRNCRNVAERGNSGDLPLKRGISKYSFLNQKERWGEQTCNQLKTVEQFCCLSTFQNRGAELAEAFDPEGRLDDRNRSERCLHPVPTDPQHQPLLRSIYGGTRYQFLCLPFGLGPAPLLFAKLLKPVVTLLRRLSLTMIIYLCNITYSIDIMYSIKLQRVL